MEDHQAMVDCYTKLNNFLAILHKLGLMDNIEYEHYSNECVAGIIRAIQESERAAAADRVLQDTLQAQGNWFARLKQHGRRLYNSLNK